jgi:hypothetical protein
MKTSDALNVIWNLILCQQTGCNTSLNAFEQILLELGELEILENVRKVRAEINLINMENYL